MVYCFEFFATNCEYSEFAGHPECIQLIRYSDQLGLRINLQLLLPVKVCRETIPCVFALIFRSGAQTIESSFLCQFKKFILRSVSAADPNTCGGKHAFQVIYVPTTAAKCESVRETVSEMRMRKC
jgi:hypothetical protein